MIDKFTDWVNQIQAIAQTGLAYTKDVYDKERYQQLMSLVQEIVLNASDLPQKKLPKLLVEDIGYATPKLDVRAFILDKKNRVLMVQEAQDGLWSLPGGWAEVNHSPKECAIKEVVEETGLTITISRLLAFWDKRHHDHPPHWPHTYKCVFSGEVIDGYICPNHEVLNVDYFAQEQLPPLSLHRITNQQIHRLYQLIKEEHSTEFD